MKVRYKPVEFDAVQWDGVAELPCGRLVPFHENSDGDVREYALRVYFHLTTVLVRKDDWLVFDEDGALDEVYTPLGFTKRFQVVEDN